MKAFLNTAIYVFLSVCSIASSVHAAEGNVTLQIAIEENFEYASPRVWRSARDLFIELTYFDDGGNALGRTILPSHPGPIRLLKDYRTYVVVEYATGRSLHKQSRCWHCSMAWQTSVRYGTHTVALTTAELAVEQLAAQGNSYSVGSTPRFSSVDCTRDVLANTLTCRSKVWVTLSPQDDAVDAAIEGAGKPSYTDAEIGFNRPPQ